MRKHKTPEHREKIRLALTGLKRSEETRKRISESRLGEKNPFYGRHHTPEVMARITAAHKGEKNNWWRGDDVGYKGVHKWARLNVPTTGRCQICGDNKKKLQIANISGKYLRRINDWLWLCVLCHMIYDNRLSNLKQFRNM